MKESQNRLKQLFNRFNDAIINVRLHIYEKKTEYLVIERRELPIYKSMIKYQFEFKRVDNFKYLSTIIK